MIESGALFFILFGLFLFLSFRGLFKSSTSRNTYNSNNRTEYQKDTVKKELVEKENINSERIQVLSMDQRKEIVTRMIKYRLDIKNDGDTYNLRPILYSLSLLEIMSMPEATIFNIVYPYLKRLKQGKSDSMIIDELEKEDNNWSPNNLQVYPKSIKEYISFKLCQDFGSEAKPYFSPLYDNYISTIKDYIKY